MTKKQSTEQVVPGHDNGARLTPMEAAAIVKSWGISEDKEAAELLLILRSVCYERELLQRENIVIAIEDVLTALAPCARKALDEVARDRLTVARSLIREGGKQ